MAGESKNFFAKAEYLIEIDGIRNANFKTCSELSVEVGEINEREGGNPLAQKRPGNRVYADITIEGLATQDRELYDWFQDVANSATGRGLADGGYKRNFDIVQLDLDGSELRRWTIYKAWPKKFVAGSWDAEAEEGVVESVVVAIDRFDITA